MNCRYSTGSVSGGGSGPFTNYNFRMIDAASEQSLMDLDLRNYICLSFNIYHQMQRIFLRVLLINILNYIHSTLYTLHSTLYTLHSSLYTLHSTLYTLHSTLYTLHSNLYTFHSTLYTLHPIYTVQCTLYNLLPICTNKIKLKYIIYSTFMCMFNVFIIMYNKPNLYPYQLLINNILYSGFNPTLLCYILKFKYELFLC